MVNLAINLPRGKVVLTSSWRRACQEHWLKCRVEKPRAEDSRVEYWGGWAKVSGARFKVANSIPYRKNDTSFWKKMFVIAITWKFVEWNTLQPLKRLTYSFLQFALHINNSEWIFVMCVHSYHFPCFVSISNSQSFGTIHFTKNRRLLLKIGDYFCQFTETTGNAR